MVTTVFIDGGYGTTGLCIANRLKDIPHIKLQTISPEKSKCSDERRRLLNTVDIAILCLPDEASREATAMIENKHTRIIDASPAFRITNGWIYGLPEIDKSQRYKIKHADKVSIPGCHASGFILITRPLVDADIISKGACLSCFSVTGYSGGGKQMIADYQFGPFKGSSPRQYAMTQNHKHVPEMCKFSGLIRQPIFLPVVADFYSGMAVTVPLADVTPDSIREILSDYYCDEKIVHVLSKEETDRLNGIITADTYAGLDIMGIIVQGIPGHVTVTALYDNLGKGASAAALQCLNIMLEQCEWNGLRLS